MVSNICCKHQCSAEQCEGIVCSGKGMHTSWPWRHMTFLLYAGIHDHPEVSVGRRSAKDHRCGHRQHILQAATKAGSLHIRLLAHIAHSADKLGQARLWTHRPVVCTPLHPFDSQCSQLHRAGSVLYTCHLCSGTCTGDQKTTTNIAAFAILLTGGPASRSCSWRPCMRLQHNSRLVRRARHGCTH